MAQYYDDHLTLCVSNAQIYGNHCVITGNGNQIFGNHCTVIGTGTQNFGTHNTLVGGGFAGGCQDGVNTAAINLGMQGTVGGNVYTGHTVHTSVSSVGQTGGLTFGGVTGSTPGRTATVVRSKGQSGGITAASVGNVVAGRDTTVIACASSTGTSQASPTVSAIRPGDKKALLPHERCLICIQKERAVACLPCGHFAACVACAREAELCPVCGIVVTRYSPEDDTSDSE